MEWIAVNPDARFSFYQPDRQGVAIRLSLAGLNAGDDGEDDFDNRQPDETGNPYQCADHGENQESADDRVDDQRDLEVEGFLRLFCSEWKFVLLGEPYHKGTDESGNADERAEGGQVGDECPVSVLFLCRAHSGGSGRLRVGRERGRIRGVLGFRAVHGGNHGGLPGLRNYKRAGKFEVEEGCARVAPGLLTSIV